MTCNEDADTTRTSVPPFTAWRDGGGQWWRCYGDANWQFDADGCMRPREASIDDV